MRHRHVTQRCDLSGKCGRAGLEAELWRWVGSGLGWLPGGACRVRGRAAARAGRAAPGGGCPGRRDQGQWAVRCAGQMVMLCRARRWPAARAGRAAPGGGAGREARSGQWAKRSPMGPGGGLQATVGLLSRCPTRIGRRSCSVVHGDGPLRRPGAQRPVQRRPERRVQGSRHVLKGAFRSLGDMNAPFRTPATSSTRLSGHASRAWRLGPPQCTASRCEEGVLHHTGGSAASAGAAARQAYLRKTGFTGRPPSHGVGSPASRAWR